MLCRLKSLELHGYKTFASRTLFEYAGAITAIVGPNGSGKSNIADSIRWVLGEQSYSLLRGKRTEDMIFSGSETRSRSSMASATVVFDNTDNWLPIDFSEVAITRRAYRDGQNEYLINGQKVRLKDVSELLAQSGLAERTYTIIGQGLVDAALALKAEDRRQLFEEAAGIGLYRGRKEESLRRLEATKRNIERAQDVLSELEPRLRSLEKQAQRAKEYEQVKNDLKAQLLEWYGYHWHKDQKDLTEAIDQTRQKEILLKQIRQQQESSESSLLEKRKDLQKTRGQIQQSQTEIVELNQQRENAARNVAILSERAQSYKRQIDLLLVDQEYLSAEKILADELVEKAKEDVNRIEAEHEDTLSQSQYSRTQLEIRQKKRAELDGLINSHQAKINTVIAKKAENDARKVEKKSHILRLRQATEETLKSSEKIKKTRIGEEQRVTTLGGELERIERQYNQITEKIGDLNSKRKKLQEEKDKLESKYQENTGDLAGISAQYNVLNEAELSLTGYSLGAQLLVNANTRGELIGVKGILAQNVVVQSGFEKAITAALGDHSDLIVAVNREGAFNALDYLLENNTRGVLLPIGQDTAHRHPRPVISMSNSILGWASDFVEAMDEWKSAISLLLGNVLIVDNRKTAEDLRSTVAADVIIVTINGEGFYSEGMIVAGSDSKASTIGRYRQIEDMRKKISSIEEKLKRLDREKQRLTNDESLLSSIIETTERELEEVQRHRFDTKNLYDQSMSNLGQSTIHLDLLSGEANRIVNEIETLEAEISRDSQNDSQLEDEIQLLYDESQALQDQLSSLPLEEYQYQAVHWDAVLRISQKTSADTKLRLAERTQNLDRIEAVRIKNNNEIKNLQNLSQELELELEQLQGVVVTSRMAIDAKVLALVPLEADALEIESHLDDAMEQETNHQKHVISLEQQYAQARINLTRQQERFDSLRRRIEEDFGLVAFDYNEEISGPTPLPLNGMVEKLPQISHISPELDESIKHLRTQLRRMGPINPEAKVEYEQVKDRYHFMIDQISDLEKAKADLMEIIAELDIRMLQDFRKTFEAVADEFRIIFSRLFSGGSARLILTEPDDINQTGIDIEAHLPGRRMHGLSLLSGGERSLTATALVFSLLKVSPTPFCVLDEVDAMLDELNVSRFRDLLRELSEKTQFIIVTHNRNTVQVADVIYGVTMGKDSTSQVISVNLAELDKVV